MTKNKIYVGCAWCKVGLVKLTKEKMIQDIQDFVVTDTNVWGGYVCETCAPTQEPKKDELTVKDIENLLHLMGENYRNSL